MYSRRITKYNPQYRNKHGAYLKDEWTAISDIGKTFNHELCTFENYIAVENAYVQAVLLFVDYLKIPSFLLTSLEDHDILERGTHLTTDMINLYKKIKKKQLIPKKELDPCIRLILREIIWGKLESDLMQVHFG